MHQSLMHLKEILFSFQGRIRRATYWKTILVMMVVYLIVFAVLGGLMAAVESPIVMLLTVILYIPMTWASFALQAKRWHDRDKSGWFVLVGFIPIVGPIWAFVEAGCMAGTEGSNRFGPPEA